MLRIAVFLCVAWALGAWSMALEEENGSFSPIVTTLYGNVQGSRKRHNGGQQYDEFLGLPFGAPPIGQQRWERPSQPPLYTGTHNATWWGRHCEQLIGPGYELIGSTGETGEDCLNLNVWVPGGVANQKEPLPVMVYAHGGAFLIGTGGMYPGQELAVTAQVIVVTFNYRVSSLGFLSTGDDNAPGNYGLWDARAALLWVRDNIKGFGGDPKRVVMMGQSAGGAISSHFVTSPMTKGLYQRVISMSGASTAFFGCANDNTAMGRNLGRFMLCPTWTNKAMVKCLRKKDSDSLDLGGYISSILLGGRLPGWVPVVDGDLIPKAPREAWEEGAGADIDLLIGRTQDDGAGFVYLNPLGIPDGDTNLASSKALLDFVIKLVLKPFGNTTKLLQVLKEEYPGITDDDELARTKAASQLLTDFAFASPAYLEAGIHSKNAASTGKGTYVYNFRYRQSFQGYASWVKGSHLDDIWSLFGEPFLSDLRSTLGGSSETDRLVSANIMMYFGNFAHTGNPNKGPHSIPTEWPRYTRKGEEYLELNSKMTVQKVSEDMRTRFKFWLETWPRIVEESKMDSPFFHAEDNVEKEFNRLAAEILHNIKSYMKKIGH